MSKYIKNINLFLSQTKIKSSYVSLKSRVDEKEISHILSEIQEINNDDMNRIAKALGNGVNFFLSDKLQENINYNFQEITYPEKMSEKQKQQTDKTLQLLENVDLVMSSKERFKNISK